MIDMLHMLSTNLVPADAVVLASPIWAVWWRAAMETRRGNADRNETHSNEAVITPA